MNNNIKRIKLAIGSFGAVAPLLLEEQKKKLSALGRFLPSFWQILSLAAKLK